MEKLLSMVKTTGIVPKEMPIGLNTPIKFSPVICGGKCICDYCKCNCNCNSNQCVCHCHCDKK